MSLSNVWVQTLSDRLVRADQVTGIDAHQTPALTGKPSRWLLDVVLPVSIGSGHREGWGVTVLRTLLPQTSAEPGNAAAALGRLLAQLDLISAAGIITTSRGDQQPTGEPTAAPDEEELVAEASQVRFRFVPFPHQQPGQEASYMASPESDDISTCIVLAHPARCPREWATADGETARNAKNATPAAGVGT